MRRSLTLLFCLLCTSCRLLPDLQISIHNTVQPSTNGSYLPVACTTFDIDATAAYECGYVTVPADHLHPEDGRQLQLAVAVTKAAADGRQPDPIVFLQDGPGYGVVYRAQTHFLTNFGPYPIDRDVVWIDPRGVGLSQPTTSCQSEMSDFYWTTIADNTLTDEAYADQFFAQVAACMQRLEKVGIDFAVYNRLQNALDILVVTKALGYDQINLYGSGYGAQLALTLLQTDATAEPLRSAVLSGLYPTDINPLETAIHLQERLEAVFAACMAETGCNAAYPDLRMKFYDLLAALDRTPVPVTVKATDREITAYADDATLLHYVLNQLSLGNLAIETLPQNLTAFHNGDSNIVARDVSFLYGNQYVAATAAAQCQDTFAAVTSRLLVQTESAIDPGFIDFAMRYLPASLRFPTFCTKVGLDIATPPMAESTVSDHNVPILAFHGAFDPLTSTDGVKRALVDWEQPKIYTLIKGGHELLLDFCAQQMAAQFFATPDQPLDDRCLAKNKLVFNLPITDATFAPLVRTTAANVGISTLVPQSWAEDFAKTGLHPLGKIGAGIEVITLDAITQEDILPALEKQKWLLIWQSNGEMDLGDHHWQLYEDNIGILHMDIAVTQAENGTFYALRTIVSTDSVDADLIYETVFIPALENFHVE
ncbi:MAG: alpha/beta fold hydrolase [Caldilineaceae bacterium]|nr:alpha/beta fold hydrolase [Caldilineaceae bacterium]